MPYLRRHEEEQIMSNYVKQKFIGLVLVDHVKRKLGRLLAINFYGKKVLGCFRLGNLDLDFKIRISDLQSNAKSENGFQR